MNYSVVVSSCFKEARGKLVVFIVYIVERFYYFNKRGIRKKKWLRGVYNSKFLGFGVGTV